MVKKLEEIEKSWKSYPDPGVFLKQLYGVLIETFPVSWQDFPGHALLGTYYVYLEVYLYTYTLILK